MKQTPLFVSPESNKARNTYVVQHITAALVAMLAESALEDISVSALCTKAGVGRVSFYRNYKSKEDVLRQYVASLSREWAVEWQKNNASPLSAHILCLFSHFVQHRAFYAMLHERGYSYLLKDAILAIVCPQPCENAAQAYAAAFTAYSLYGWVDTWLRRGMRETPAELEQLFRAQGL